MKRNILVSLVIRSKHLPFFVFLGLFISVVMFFNSNVFAEEHLLDRNQKSDFAGGSGTYSDPWLIETPEQLDLVRNYLNDYFLLLNNLDLDVYPFNSGSGWEPIGTIINPFKGHFNGGGFYIFNLFIERPYGRDNGLFGHMIGGTLSDVKLKNVFVNGRYKVGSLLGTAFSGTEISNCSAENIELHVEERFSGGLVGSADDISLYRCSAEGMIFKNAYFDWNFIGGLIGSITSSTTNTGSRVIECFAKVGIISEAHNSYGGLVGTMWYKAEIVNSYAIGSIVANGDRAGGLVGDASLGNGKKSVINSYAAVNIDTDPYASDVRGFVGMPSGGPFEGNFYDIQVAGSTNTDWSATPKSTAAMKNTETYLEAGWDFDNVWEIDPEGIINDGYPFLRWNESSNICYKPFALEIVALNDTAVGFEWQLMDQSQTSDLAIGPAGFDPNNEGWVIPDLEETFFNIDTLTAATDYDVYVRNTCQNGGYSDWLGPLSFQTFSIFELMGGGSFCFGQTDSLSVYLAESDSSIYYTLYHQGDSIGPALQSHGDTISWMVSDTGTYRVLAFNEKGSVWMEGQVNVSVLPLPDVFLVLNFDTICADVIPFLLTGGYPTGGVFSGEGVINNYFFAEQLEPGFHTINYSCTNEYGCTNLASADYYLDECSGLTEALTDSQSLIITPNPVDELLTISSNGIIAFKRLVIYDLNGQEIKNVSIFRDIKKLEINVSHLPAGSYIVKLEGKSKIKLLKFIKN
ncbi:MAG: T9SS type A sorting domain-containing protein [Bacteroidales bacterium]|nr:T9SS type A sorting domain-containing protein [Bacteroidales bacterium]